MTGRAGPRNAQERLRHLLVMLPWLMERDEVPLAEVAARFDVTESQVVADLELVAMCGLPPYIDEMIDVWVDEGMVSVGVPRLFTRPLRLTAPEGFSLLAAGRAAMELPGADLDGPLARGLTKLADTLGRVGLDAGDDLGVAVDLSRPPLTDDVVAAIEAGHELRVSYYSPTRGEASERTIVPRHVFVESGNWYVLVDVITGAVSSRDGVPGETGPDRRTFRIDRIESMAATGVVHDIDPTATAPAAFFIDADLPRVTLRLSPAAQWIVDRYPTDSVRPVSTRSNKVDVVLPISSDWWLNRLLVRLGPDARLVDPDGAASGAQALAEAILANY